MRLTIPIAIALNLIKDKTGLRRFPEIFAPGFDQIYQ